MFLWSWMPTWPIGRSTWWLVGSNRFLYTEPCNSFLSQDMNKNIKQTSRTVGTPPIPISTTCRKQLPFSVTFSASNQYAQSPSPQSALGERRFLLHHPSFQRWSGCPSELPVIGDTQIHGTPKLPWCNISWWYDEDFRAYDDNTHDKMHHMAIASATQECIMYKSCNQMYILD